MAWWSRRPRAKHGSPPLVDGFSDGDLAELDDVFAAAEAEEARHRDTQLAIRMAPLVARAVPARRIEPVPGVHAARIRFADGTAVFVRGRKPGDVGVLARWLTVSSVVPVGCSTTSVGTELTLRVGNHPYPFVLRLTGLDQPE